MSEHKSDLDEREIEADTWVVDRRHRHEGQRGVVTACRRFGPGADPYYLADVLWADDTREHNINTIWLAGEPVEEAAR